MFLIFILLRLLVYIFNCSFYVNLYWNLLMFHFFLVLVILNFLLKNILLKLLLLTSIMLSLIFLLGYPVLLKLRVVLLLDLLVLLLLVYHKRMMPFSLLVSNFTLKLFLKFVNLRLIFFYLKHIDRVLFLISLIISLIILYLEINRLVLILLNFFLIKKFNLVTLFCI